MMKWWSSVFRSWSRTGWMQVPVLDDQDETGMDDLMRMAGGQYPEDERDHTNNMAFDNDNHVRSHVDCASRDVQSCSSSSSSCSSSVLPTTLYDQQRNTETETACKRSCSCGFPKLTFPKRRWYIIVLSILVALFFIGLNVALGIYSLIFYHPDQLVIDKSVKSFSIPNHEAYKNYEALMLARKDNSSSGKYRRDLSKTTQLGVKWNDALFAKEREMLRQAESVLKGLKHEHTGFIQKKQSQESPHLWSFSAERNEPPLREFSIGSTFNSILQRMKRSTHEINCLFEYQSVARWRMHVIYLAQGNSDTNIFTKERLETAHEIEKKIMQHPGFSNFCLRDPKIHDPAVRDMKGCVPLNSLLTYFFPSKDSNGNVFYDGMGINIADIDSSLQLAMNDETFYYYVDEKINKTYQKSHLLRSEVLFGAPLPGFSCVGDQRKDQDEKFKDFVVTYIDLLSKSSTDKVRVLYGGNEIFDYEVTTSFWSDVRLAIISLIAIFVLMLVLSLSIYLTIVGVVVIAVSFPISLFFYRVVFKINALGILNGAAAFVIIGIGVDDIFVFVNIYRQASHMKDPVKRIWYTVKTAGIATFFTSFTTAAAFAANIASSIPAVYEFGLFMSLIVSSCWISVFVLMPAMLYLHVCFFEPFENVIFGYFSCAKPKNRIPSRASLHWFDQQQTSEQRLYQEDDVPMLDMEIDEPSRRADNAMDDENILIGDPYVPPADPVTSAHDDVVADFRENNDIDAANSTEDDTSNVCLGHCIQKLLLFLTNRLVIKGRYFVMGFCGLLLVASTVLMTQLQPSTHPPQLFRPDTNLQQLLDLKANFTIIETIRCDQCSGLYKVKPSKTDSGNDNNIVKQHPLSSLSTLPFMPTNAPDSSSNKDNLSLSTFKSHDGQSPNNGGSHNDGNQSAGSQVMLNLGEHTDSVPLKMLASTLLNLLSSVSSTPSDGPQKTSTLTPPHYHHSQTTHVLKSKTTASPKSQSVLPSHQNTHAGNTEQSHEPSKSSSVDENFNACIDQSCDNLKDRPLMESGATVYVVFGIKGVDRSQEEEGHVLNLFKGKAIFDSKFAEAFGLQKLDKKHLGELCKICSILSNQTDLVKAGSAQCIPNGLYSLHTFLHQIPECRDLPNSHFIYNRQAPAHAEGGLDRQQRLLWLAFAFESTTSEGQAYFEAYKQYEKWEKLIAHIKENVLSSDSPLRSIYQTSEFWTKVLMEVVAVNSAIYGLVLSMIICIMAVAVFTGHLVLLVIVVVTIKVMICCVVGIFYLAGWEMGAVEAVSLSILVGSSVDYCVHIVEGYILAGRRMPNEYLITQPARNIRRQRTFLAVRHIGVAIICSALTTIIAAVPLTQTYIQPFAKFGSILLINTTVSMVMTLTLATAMLATFGPAHYKGSFKSHLIAFIVVCGVIGVSVLGLYIASTQGVSIPGPSGNPLFS